MKVKRVELRASSRTAAVQTRRGLTSTAVSWYFRSSYQLVRSNSLSYRAICATQHDPESMETNEYDDDPNAVNPRKRKEPDSRVR